MAHTTGKSSDNLHFFRASQLLLDVETLLFELFSRGDIVDRSPQFEQAVVIATVTPRQGATPYVRFGNWPVVSLSLLLVVAGLMAGRQR